MTFLEMKVQDALGPNVLERGTVADDVPGDPPNVHVGPFDEQNGPNETREVFPAPSPKEFRQHHHSPAVHEDDAHKELGLGEVMPRARDERARRELGGALFPFTSVVC